MIPVKRTLKTGWGGGGGALRNSPAQEEGATRIIQVGNKVAKKYGRRRRRRVKSREKESGPNTNILGKREIGTREKTRYHKQGKATVKKRSSGMKEEKKGGGKNNEFRYLEG